MAEGVPPAAVVVKNTNPRQDRLRAQITGGGGDRPFVKVQSGTEQDSVLRGRGTDSTGDKAEQKAASLRALFGSSSSSIVDDGSSDDEVGHASGTGQPSRDVADAKINETEDLDDDGDSHGYSSSGSDDDGLFAKPAAATAGTTHAGGERLVLKPATESAADAAKMVKMPLASAAETSRLFYDSDEGEDWLGNGTSVASIGTTGGGGDAASATLRGAATVAATPQDVEKEKEEEDDDGAWLESAALASGTARSAKLPTLSFRGDESDDDWLTGSSTASALALPASTKTAGKAARPKERLPDLDSLFDD